MSALYVFAWSLFGGVVCELLHWNGLKKANVHFPVYAGTLKYWLITALMVLAGALIAVAVNQSGTNLTPLTAIVVGYSAPSLIQHLAKNTKLPKLGGPALEAPPSVHRFLIG